MRTHARRVAALVVSVAVAGTTVIAACGNDAASPDSLVPILTTTTSLPPATTTPAVTVPATTIGATSTSTTTPTSTTVVASTTTTLVPVAASLLLSDSGLGDALFGAEPGEVVAYLTAILGAPTADSGWVDPTSSFGVCPGSEVRGVTWADLTVLFSDSSSVMSGRRHFFNYLYGPPTGASIQPEGMRTVAGIGVGSTVADLLAAYPDAQVYPEDLYGPYFVINENLTGFLTGTSPSDTILSFIGGIGCGE
ncbi:MAG: hypothetical protein RLZZ623_3772 [Actinomycetota bacterium]|jgi:hypothetical protein